jgi:hypothetical protein
MYVTQGGDGCVCELPTYLILLTRMDDMPAPVVSLAGTGCLTYTHPSPPYHPPASS